jgi:hypothetical protein
MGDIWLCGPAKHPHELLADFRQVSCSCARRRSGKSVLKSLLIGEIVATEC